MRVNLMDDLRWALYRFAGKLTAAWAVRMWGDPEEAQPGGNASPTTGMKWTLKNYAIAWLAGAVGGEMTSRFKFFSPAGGQQFYNGALDLVLTKALWSEAVHRLGGTYGAKYFGQTDNQFAVLAEQANEGDIIDDGTGNRYELQGGKWVAMMGYDGMGALETATPFDGYQQRRFQESMANEGMGALETATPFDGGYGHLQPRDVDAASAYIGKYQYKGSPNPYRAAYMPG